MNGDHGHEVMLSLTAAISLGVFLIVLARILKQPGIILLLVGGVILGPEILGIVQPEALDEVLPTLVSLAVGIILFEGGLTLDLKGFERGSKVIQRLLTIGVLVTWFGSTLCVWRLFQTDLSFAFLAGSMIIVTGPTVIVPLLRRIHVNDKLHHILHWESVLIDPIGVFIAILCFEWVVGQQGGMAVTNFFIRVLVGMAVGLLGGVIIYSCLKKKWIPESMHNVFILGSAVFVFGITERIIEEGGLLAVTVAGFWVGWRHPVDLKQIKQFKAEITDLLIAVLFVLLVARLELEDFQRFGWAGVILLILVMFVVRPLNIFVSTWGSDLKTKEKLFLSWIAPRGIVAASMASLFAIAMEKQGKESEAALLEIFIYGVIGGTVLLQGITAGPLATLLDVRRKHPSGWLIVGAHGLARGIAKFLKKESDKHVVLMDTNTRMVSRAQRDELTALCENALEVRLLEEKPDLHSVGHILALTDNAELNALLSQKWRRQLGSESQILRWSPRRADQEEVMNEDVEEEIFCPELASPSVISSEIAAAESHLERVVVHKNSRNFEGRVLAMIRKGDVFMSPDFSKKIEKRPGDILLLLKRSGGYLWRSLENGKIVEKAVGNLADLYHVLVSDVVELYPSVSAEKLLEQLKEHDKVFPPAMGRGVAVPHVYSAGLRRRMCILARLIDGITLEGQKENIRLVFFVLSPSGDPEGHLTTLAEIARFCADEGNRKALLNASSPGAMKTLIKRKMQFST
ncbi:MAG: cation:proton antiporter [Verrucomicrobiota bacterium]